MNTDAKQLLVHLDEEMDLWAECYGNGRNADGLRFGQYFCNKYVTQSYNYTPDPFYIESPTKAFHELRKIFESQLESDCKSGN